MSVKGGKQASKKASTGKNAQGLSEKPTGKPVAKTTDDGFFPNVPPAEILKPVDFKIMAGLLVVACVVRLYKIGNPPSVVFDEVHFGGFARKYIIGRFFMDVHPPLAKMLYAVVGYLAGYDGEFDFGEIAMDYLEPNVPYIAMRMLPAVLGVATVLLGYVTLRASYVRPATALFGALLIVFENSLTTQSRYILLDSPLIFFIALTIYGYRRFEREVPFSLAWHRYLLLTGLGLGATISSKWVGLFTVGWIGTLVIWNLWNLLGDLSVTPKSYVRHFASRAVLLIGVPVAFYTGMFALHFLCVVNDGDGAAFMSPEFQSTLQHSSLGGAVPADNYYGSELVIRHWNTGGGYLHSHDSLYETGSKQQQITLYPHKDDNNIWIAENFTTGVAGETAAWQDTQAQFGLQYLKNGDVIRLKHKPTQRRLHSHDFRPPVTEQDYQNEVSCYGYEGFEGDANDNFRIEILEQYSKPGVSLDRVRTIHTKFRLIHTITGCALFSHPVKLPKWGFEQQEVTCITSGKIPNSVWFVEETYHPQLPADAEMTTYETPGFFKKFFELNRVMWDINKGLTESHTWESRPESWIALLRGINFWAKDHRQVYLLGNGPIYWSLTLIVFSFVIYKMVVLLKWQRGYYRDSTATEESRKAWSIFDYGVTSYLIGWAFHYFPSFLMERQLFLHHYLGSLYIGILAFTQFWDYLTARMLKNKIISTAVTAIFFSATIGWFIWYSPLIYGLPWTRDVCEKSKFLDMDWDCGIRFETNEEYANFDASNTATILKSVLANKTLPPSTSASATATVAGAGSGDQVSHVPHPAPPPGVYSRDADGKLVKRDFKEPTAEDDEDDEDEDEDEDEEYDDEDDEDEEEEDDEDDEEDDEDEDEDEDDEDEEEDENSPHFYDDEQYETYVPTKAAPPDARVSEPVDYREQAVMLEVDGKFVSTTLLKRMVKVNYKDENGNELPQELIEKLQAEGRIEVRTVKERTNRYLDSEGNFIEDKRVREL